MARLEVKLSPGVPSYRQRTVLDGVEYILELRWSQRSEKWFLTIRDSAGELLLGSIKLVVNFPLLVSRRGAIAGLPPGELFVVDTRESPADPGLDELGDSIHLTYADLEEISEVLA